MASEKLFKENDNLKENEGEIENSLLGADVMRNSEFVGIYRNI